MNILSIDPGINGYICVGNWKDKYVPLELRAIPTKKVKIGKSNKTRVDEESLGNLINNITQKFSIERVVIEKQQVVGSKPNEDKSLSERGITSSSVILEHYGWLKGFCKGANIEYTVVHPKTWQTIYPSLLEIDEVVDFLKRDSSLNSKLNSNTINLTKIDSKDRSKIYCAYLFSSVIELRKSKRAKNICDGITDAILIGYWYAIKGMNNAECK